jgi:hypothetical protein
MVSVHSSFIDQHVKQIVIGFAGIRTGEHDRGGQTLLSRERGDRRCFGRDCAGTREPCRGRTLACKCRRRGDICGTYSNTNDIQLFIRGNGLFYKENGRELPVSKLPSGYFVAQAPPEE